MKIIFSPTKTLTKFENEHESSTPNLELANKINDIYNVMGEESNQALFFYNGISFKYLDVLSLSKENIDYLTEHFIILSALYGCLKPLDMINRYRLDFTDKSLYDYHDIYIDDEVLNLASAEYRKMIKCKKLYNVEFKIYKDGKLSTTPVYNKMLRGLLAKYLCVNNITEIEDVKNFSGLEYFYNEELSTKKRFVFVKGSINEM